MNLFYNDRFEFTVLNSLLIGVIYHYYQVLWTRLKPGGFIAVNAIGTRGQYVEYCERLKKTGFWPIYIFAIDPNMVFFAWKSEIDQETREQEQIDTLFEKEKKKGKAGGAPSTIRETGEGDPKTHCDDGLEEGTMGWMGFRELIAKTPGLEKVRVKMMSCVHSKNERLCIRKRGIVYQKEELCI